MRKINMLSLTICIIFLVSSVTVFGVTDFGNFTYWYSNTSRIGYYSSSTVKVSCSMATGCKMPGSTLSSAASVGFNAWQSCEGLTLAAGTPTDYNWQLWGVSRSDAQSLGVPNNAEGFTASGTTTNVGVAYYSGSQKTVYSISKCDSYLVWDESGVGTIKTSGYSQAKWNAITAHEFGHAAGYDGHDTGSSSTNKALMNPYTNYYFDTWNVSVPQTRDIRHMQNI